MVDVSGKKTIDDRVSQFRELYQTRGKKYLPYAIGAIGLLAIGYFNEKYKAKLSDDEKKQYNKDVRDATVVATAAGVADLATKKL